MEHFISLGSNCLIATELRRTNKRKHAYPFDWNWTPMQSAIALIENDFEDFLNEENLVFLPQHHQELVDEDNTDKFILTREIVTPCICKKYNILFSHDFNTNGKKDLPRIKAKYKRRIDRLYEILSSPKKGDTINFIANGKDELYPLPKLKNNAHLGKRDWYSFLDRKFETQFDGWKHQFTSMMDRKFPNLSYTLHNLEDFKKR